MRPLAGGLACMLLLSWACTVEQERRPGWSQLQPGALSDVQQAQLHRATQARDVLQKSLGGRLQAALTEGTPAEAIAVCKLAAPQIAAQVRDAHHVSIGRTSQRLRNPANTPPAWAATYVASDAQEQACFAGPDDALGVLLPIRTQALCSSCHGPSDSLDADVAAALAADYPDDRALGFREGDLRGWFWVEVGL